MNDVRELCMLVGDCFDKSPYFTEKMTEWHGTEECATVAKLASEMIRTLCITPEKATDSILKHISKYGFRNIEDHAWDEYTRGFLAGQILGIPTKENLELLEKAEELWDFDDGCKYGYFQEVLEEVKGERRR